MTEIPDRRPLGGGQRQGRLPNWTFRRREQEFMIPIHFVDGEHDLTAPPELAKACFDGIGAPQKSLNVVPGPHWA